MATPSELVFSAISVHPFFFLFICNNIWMLWVYNVIIFFNFSLNWKKSPLD
jgi:hypothetical protein